MSAAERTGLSPTTLHAMADVLMLAEIGREPIAPLSTRRPSRWSTAPCRSTDRCALSAPGRAKLRQRSSPRCSIAPACGPGIDIAALLDVAEEVAAPLQPAVPVIDRDAVTLGLAGVYSSFLKHARRIGEQYGVPAHELLRAAGERRLVGGQEDLLVDIAVASSATAKDVVA
ncbi:MAG: hypothetical protein E6G10_28255 [Actinobacteria bacterium]|nr:MAG: hypothetical protein E6G10_28255 [Actinomycetota bacterium]